MPDIGRKQDATKLLITAKPGAWHHLGSATRGSGVDRQCASTKSTFPDPYRDAENRNGNWAVCVYQQGPDYLDKGVGDLVLH
jgi:hypothetical protein